MPTSQRKPASGLDLSADRCIIRIRLEPIASHPRRHRPCCGDRRTGRGNPAHKPYFSNVMHRKQALLHIDSSGPTVELRIASGSLEGIGFLPRSASILSTNKGHAHRLDHSNPTNSGGSRGGGSLQEPANRNFRTPNQPVPCRSGLFGIRGTPEQKGVHKYLG